MNKALEQAIKESFENLRGELITREKWLFERIETVKICAELDAHFKVNAFRLVLEPKTGGWFSANLTIKPKLMSDASETLRELTVLGWHRDPEQKEPYDDISELGAKRYWKLIRGEQKLTLYAEVGDDPDACHVKIVEVKEEIVKRNVYKIVCPGDEEVA